MLTRILAIAAFGVAASGAWAQDGASLGLREIGKPTNPALREVRIAVASPQAMRGPDAAAEPAQDQAPALSGGRVEIVKAPISAVFEDKPQPKEPAAASSGDPAAAKGAPAAPPAAGAEPAPR